MTINNKSITAFLLAVLMIFNILPLSVFAGNTETQTMTASLTSASGMPGDTVEVKVELANNPGISSMKLFVEYDENLELTEVIFDERFGVYVSAHTPYSNPQVLNLMSPLADISVSGTYATLKFKISEDAPDNYRADIELSYDPDNLFNGNFEPVELTTQGTSVNIYHGIPGDINNDKQVTNLDAILLFRYSSGQDVSALVDESAIDVNADGKANNRDAILIFRYVSEWPGIVLSRGGVHTHNLTKVEAKEASCTVNGNIEYYTCDSCDKLFSDANGKTQIKAEDTVVKAGHTEETIPEVKPTCTETGLTEGVRCSVCEEILTEQEDVAATGHIYAAVWSSNETHHWHAATCEHSAEISGNAKHTLDSNHICTVCTYDASATFKLATPDNVKVSYDKVTWDAVDNAEYYTVRVNGDYEIVQRGTTAPLSAVLNSNGEKLFANETGINKHGLVEVTVRANDNGNYLASDYSDIVSYYYIPDAGESDNRTLADNYRLGYGYNLIEQTFTTGIESKREILNLGKLFSIDTFSSNTQGNGGSNYSYYFTSADDYVANNTESCEITASVGGGFGPVSANLKTDLSYSSSENYKSHKYNATYISRFDQVAGTTTFGMNNSNIRIHALSDQFIKDITKENNDLRLYSDEQLCEHILKYYGTHVALGVQRGTRFVTSYVISTDSVDDSKSATAMFKVGASANVSTFFNASLDVTNQGSSTITLNSETTTSTLKSSYYGGKVASGVVDGKISINSWDGEENPVTIGLTEAIAVSSLIKQYEDEFGRLGENGSSLGEAFAAYVDARATAEYNTLYSQYTYDTPFNVKVQETEEGNVLVIDLSKYQGTGSLEGAGCTYLVDGVFTVYPNMLGKRIDKIKVVSSFDNNDIAEKNLIDGFSIALSNKWKRDVDVEFENIGVRVLENGLVDKTKTSGIAVNTTFKGINLVEQADGTSEMYIVTDDISCKVALGIENGEELFVSTIYMDEDTIILPVAEKKGYSFSGWKTPNGQLVTEKDGTLYTSVDLSNLTLLHPEWACEQYEIVLNNGYADTTGTETIIEHYGYMFADESGEQLDKITVPEKAGYSFEGYYKSVENNGYSYAEGFDEIIDKDGNIKAEADIFGSHTTIYALYKPVTYEVNLYVDSEFYGRFFEVYGEKICDENGESIDKIEGVPEKAGYTFNGFTCSLGEIVDKNGNIIPAINANFKTFAEDTEISAEFVANDYVVTFDSNGANVSVDTINVTYGKPYGTLPAITREGYTFNDWKLGDTVVTADTVVESTSDHTLVADWTAHTYTFVFDGNGATSGSTASSTHTYGVAKTLTKNGFDKTGYTFGSWNTKADGSGTSFANEQEILNHTATNGAVITLYAQWPKGNSVVVIFDANGGSAAFSEKSVVYDEEYGALPTATRMGFSFEGWYTASGTKITEDSVVKVTSSQVLYAHWNANSYKATWTVPTGVTITVKRTSSPYANASTGTLSSGATVYHGDVLSVTYSANPGYTLSGKGSTSITVTGNVTSSQIYASATVNSYTAKWTVPTGVTITVKRTSSPNANASIGTLSSGATGATVYYGDVLSVTYSANTGYTLSSKGATSITVTGNDTSSHIYASATPNTYTVTYYGNGATGGSTTTSTHTYNSSTNLKSNGFTRTNYTFLGWSTSSTSTTPTYTNGQSVKNLTTAANGIVNLYAVWVKTSGSYSSEESIPVALSEAPPEYWQTGLNREALYKSGFHLIQINIKMHVLAAFKEETLNVKIFDKSGVPISEIDKNVSKGEHDINFSFTVSLDAIRDDGTVCVQYTSISGFISYITKTEISFSAS